MQLSPRLLSLSLLSLAAFALMAVSISVVARAEPPEEAGRAAAGRTPWGDVVVSEAGVLFHKYLDENARGFPPSARRSDERRPGADRGGAVQPTAGESGRFASVLAGQDARTVEAEAQGGRVTLGGEFVRPGSYAARQGERLSELIRRAGGLTVLAFPYGAVLTRERVRRAEEAVLRRTERAVDAAVAALAARPDADETRLVVIARLSARLRATEAVGRVIIEADPILLRVRPDLDTVLETGDRLFVPRRPNYVMVGGGVHNPGAVRFEPGMTAADYIRRAGGFQAVADDSRVFVVLPNGEARRVGAGLWNYQPLLVPPGSAIMVPNDPASLDPIMRGLAPVLSLLVSAEAASNVIPETW